MGEPTTNPKFNPTPFIKSSYQINIKGAL